MALVFIVAGLIGLVVTLLAFRTPAYRLLTARYTSSPADEGGLGSVAEGAAVTVARRCSIGKGAVKRLARVRSNWRGERFSDGGEHALLDQQEVHVADDARECSVGVHDGERADLVVHHLIDHGSNVGLGLDEDHGVGHHGRDGFLQPLRGAFAPR